MRRVVHFAARTLIVERVDIEIHGYVCCPEIASCSSIALLDTGLMAGDVTRWAYTPRIFGNVATPRDVTARTATDMVA
jgi:hypothetical protein